MFGKKLNTSLPKYFFKDNNYNNIYDAWKEINIFNKRIYNEDRLKLFLEEYGFECFDPGIQFHKKQCKKIIRNDNGMGYVATKIQCVGGCKIEDLIKYMNEVKVMISVSSSALQNILFMNKEESSVIEIVTKFYQMEGQDSDRTVREMRESISNPQTGEFDIEVMNRIINKTIKSHGEYHVWHRDLANRLGINYLYIPNRDLNGRTVIKSIKDHNEIFKIVSE